VGLCVTNGKTFALVMEAWENPFRVFFFEVGKFGMVAKIGISDASNSLNFSSMSYELSWLELELILNAAHGMPPVQVVNLLKTTLTCTAYALVIGKNSADVWTAAGQEGSWFVSARDAA